jgi:hypothetical protein
LDKLFENEANTTAIYSNGSEYLLLKLSGRIDFEDYKRAMLLLVEKLQEVNTRQIILDSYDLEYDTPKSRIWFLTSFIYKIQRTVGENLWVAIIRPRNTFQKLAIGTLVSLVKSQGFLFEIKFCNDQCDAVGWFEQFALQKG